VVSVESHHTHGWEFADVQERENSILKELGRSHFIMDRFQPSGGGGFFIPIRGAAKSTGIITVMKSTSPYANRFD
jgi:hypothetical protein